MRPITKIRFLSNRSISWLCAFVIVVALCRQVSGQESDEEDSRGSTGSGSIDVHNHPKSGFSCAGKRSGEYYADPHTQCRLYFVCLPNAHLTLSPTSFACPNSTRFNQATRVCSPEDQVYCQIASRYYENVNGGIDSRDPNIPNEYLSNFDVTPWQQQGSRPKVPKQPLIVPFADSEKPQHSSQPQYSSQPAISAPPSIQGGYIGYQPIAPQAPRYSPPPPRREPSSNVNRREPSTISQPAVPSQPSSSAAGRTRSRTSNSNSRRPQPAPANLPLEHQINPAAPSAPSRPRVSTSSAYSSQPGRARFPSYLNPARPSLFPASTPALTSPTTATASTTTTTTSTTTTTTPAPSSPGQPNVDYIYDYIEYDQNGQPINPNGGQPSLPAIGSPLNKPSTDSFKPPALPKLTNPLLLPPSNPSHQPPLSSGPSSASGPGNSNQPPKPGSIPNLNALFHSAIAHAPSLPNLRPQPPSPLGRPPQRPQHSSSSSSSGNSSPSNSGRLSSSPNIQNHNQNINNNHLSYFQSNPFAGNPFAGNPFSSNGFQSGGDPSRQKRSSSDLDWAASSQLSASIQPAKPGKSEVPAKALKSLTFPPASGSTPIMEEDEFNCQDKLPGIGYADVSSKCRMFHICLPESKGKYKDYQLFCESGHGYNQFTANCEPLDKFDCKQSRSFYLYNKQANPEAHMKNKYRINKQLSAIKN